MHVYTESWGYVALSDALPGQAMTAAQEESEIVMLRLRFGKKKLSASPRISLGGYLPATERVIFNPGTLQDIATIFETNIERVFS